VVGVYLAIDFFQKIDNFMLADIPLARMITYFMLKLPLVVSQIMPVCILLGVLIAFGLMNKNNEIIALKCGGVSVYYLLRPVLVIGIVFSIFQFLLSEAIVPVTITKAHTIWLSEVKKKTLSTYRQKNIWIKGNRSIYFINYYNPQKNMISGISLNYFDNDFRLIKRVDAKEGIYKEGKWVLFNLMEQVLDGKDREYRVSFFDERVAQVDFVPQDLKHFVKKSEEMSATELFEYIQDVESEGYDATAYRVDFHAKFAIPLVCVIMCIIGTGIAVKRRIKEGLSISIAFGGGMIFLYYVSYSFCLSLGYGELLPPILATWISNVIFACLGIVNLINAE
ncbi:MAG: LPS export ABC transporter permease LptG, partial [Desulfobacterales bacterium]